LFNLGPDGGAGGRAEWESARLAAELVNADGGIRLPDGARAPLELVVYDDDGVPERTTLAIRSLTEEEGVFALIGPSDPEAVRAASLAAERAQVPLVVLRHARAADDARAAWSFWLASRDDQALVQLVEFLAGTNATRIGWIAPRSAFGDAARATLGQYLAGTERSLVAEESYPLQDTDVDERFVRLADAGVDNIIAWPRTAREAAELARAAAERAPRARLYLGPAAASDTFLSLAGRSSQGVRVVAGRLLVPEQLWEDDPLTAPVQEFARAFRTRYGAPASPAGAPAWDAVRLVVDALGRAGADRQRLRDALEGTDELPGASGLIGFHPRDHVGLDRSAFLIVRVDGGAWRIPA